MMKNMIYIITILIFSQLFGIDISIRLGQGGLNDHRAEDNALGGGQLAIDYTPKYSNFSFSLATESYTKSENPTNYYEIKRATIGYLLYNYSFCECRRAKLYGGAGVGWLTVPKRNSDGIEEDSHFMLESVAGIKGKIFWKFGGYAELRYLYCEKREDGDLKIGFNDPGLMVGVSYNFGW